MAALRNAAEQGDAQEVARLLADSAQLDTAGEQGTSALVLALVDRVAHLPFAAVKACWAEAVR